LSYTLEDLQKAKAEQAAWQKKWEDYSGNNPDKFRAERIEADRKVRQIEDELKAAGIIPLSEKELLERELDKEFPDAQSRQIVTHNGQRYQRRFQPASKSRSGKTVNGWIASWLLLGPADTEK